MNTVVIESKQGSIPGKISFGILGFAYAVAVYRIPAFLVGSFFISTGGAVMSTVSFLIQFVVGALLSFLAYKSASNTSLKAGMRVCYGTVIAFLCTVGGYSIITSLASLA